MEEFFKGYVYAPYLMETTTEIISGRELGLLKIAKEKHKAINREGKITSILEDTDFEEIKIEDITEYKEYLKSGFSPSKSIKNRYQTINIITGYKPLIYGK